MSPTNSLFIKREETTTPNLLLELFWPLEFLTDRVYTEVLYTANKTALCLLSANVFSAKY